MKVTAEIMGAIMPYLAPMVSIDEVREKLAATLRSQADALSGESGTDDDDEMEKISKLIARLQDVLDRFGDTCVYIRRGGLSWGAVALNRQSDDKEHGVFDLQATHDREMTERLEQIERLIADRNEWRQRAWTAEAAIGGPGK